MKNETANKWRDVQSLPTRPVPCVRISRDGKCSNVGDTGDRVSVTRGLIQKVPVLHFFSSALQKTQRLVKRDREGNG